ncbi:hypothetical protein CCA_00585 [Chlamydia caviae GPIC]|uniref:Uncharacterized protein n=1 Tax=Chlamydia caviae (strain ATCC VR-813 / DSM 19441 / 03DC25 / GPIC) TaxID=227941 RepID=Q822U4_CHLCV|nr:hypothetical protein CCA_00585 [Chlamydia caviae GPIC]
MEKVLVVKERDQGSVQRLFLGSQIAVSPISCLLILS